MSDGWLEAPTGSVGAHSDLTAPLGAPYIIKPEDWARMEQISGPAAQTKNAIDISKGFTSLVDNAFNQRMKLAQDKATLDETVARTGQIGALTDNIQSESDQRKRLTPLLVQQDSQRVQQNKYALDEAQRQADTLDKALGEYGSWNGELSALDPTDPDYDSKVAAINTKYPEASMNPRTQALITPMLTEHNLKRSQSDLVQQRTDQLNQVRDYVQSGLLPPDTDVRGEVNNGRGQALISQAKGQAVIHRLQTVTAYGDQTERAWAQGQIDAMTGKGLGPGETPDRTMFSPTGDLNPGSEALLSTIERRRGITPVAPGAKKEIKTIIDPITGLPKTETTISGMPVTQSDINAQTPQTPAAVPGAPTTAADMQKDPVFQSMFSDLAQGKLTLPGNPKVGSPEQTAALYTEYAKRKAAAAGGQQPAQPRPAPTPAPPASRRVPGLRGQTGQVEEPGAQTELATAQPGATPRLPTSNNDYRFPEAATDVMGIDRNVWANVMSEEGREFGKDGSHDSVFGLWADAPGAEGAGYRAVRHFGPDSPEAFHAVTGAWTSAFLHQSQPWQLRSPGLQEMVIADSQHVGGAKARAIIDRMGGYDAVNAMDPAQAIARYSELRKPLWPGNNRQFRDGASDRVTREREWAQRHNDQLAGTT
jgi:hypothetical protein